MRDDPFESDYLSAKRCECGAWVGTARSAAVVVCVECAIGETPAEKLLFCPDCGTQRSRFDTGKCSECQLRKYEAENRAKFGEDWKEIMRQMREEYDRLTLKAWEEADAE